MSHTIFPTNLPEQQWVTFDAEGFSRPVTGVIHRRGRASPGMPPGAIGTGFISLGTDGALEYVNTIFNSFLERREAALAAAKSAGSKEIHRLHVPSYRLPFLGICVGGRARLLSLKTMDEVEGAETDETHAADMAAGERAVSNSTGDGYGKMDKSLCTSSC